MHVSNIKSQTSFERLSVARTFRHTLGEMYTSLTPLGIIYGLFSVL